MWKQILASFLLCVIGMMILHSAFPHIHHAHETADGIAKYTDHYYHPDEQHDRHSHEDASYHEHDQDSKNDEPGSLLSFLLNNHSHTFHNHEYIQIANAGSHYSVDEYVPVAAILAIYYSSLKYDNQSFHRYSLFKRTWYDNPSLVNCSLRGPPSLG